jgi:hypothetical protein
LYTTHIHETQTPKQPIFKRYKSEKIWVI